MSKSRDRDDELDARFEKFTRRPDPTRTKEHKREALERERQRKEKAERKYSAE